ncbi:MAG TPA: hypothetical protein VFQ61_26880 [Polyangiaceae bacterium]|nr:hypothetical protein [Polyangiaceae bacterium]
MRNWLLTSIGTAALLHGACVPEFSNDLSQVRGARIVGIRSEPAEAREGAMVTFEALWVAPLDAETPNIEYHFCLDRTPLTELGSVNPSCAAEPPPPGKLADSSSNAAPLQSLGSGVRVDTAIPNDACRLFGPRRPEPKPGEPSGRPVDPDPTGGFYQPVVAWIEPQHRALGSTRLDCGLTGAAQATQREFASRYRSNQNPELADLQIVHEDGTIVSSAGRDRAVSEPARLGLAERVTLRALWAACPREPTCGDHICGEGEDLVNCAEDCTRPRGCTGAESYAFYDREARTLVRRREGITVSWYTTAGHFSSERTGRSEQDVDESETTVEYRAPDRPGEVGLWAVIHDDRGGTGIQFLKIDVGL